jgi:hypothetical protein
MAYTLCFLFARDAHRAWSRRRHFLYIDAPIILKCIPVDRESSLQSPDHRTISSKLKIRDGALVRNESQDIAKEKEEELFVDQIVLHEADALGYHVLGPDLGGKWFHYMSLISVRITVRIMCSIAAVFYALSLCGLLPSQYGLFILLTVIPGFVAFSLKSRSMLKLLMLRTEFWLDTLLVGLVFIAGSVVLADERAAGMVMLFVKFVDERTTDSRVVLHKKRSKDTLRTPRDHCLHVIYIFSAFLFVLSILSFPLLFSFGLVKGPNVGAEIDFRPLDNLTANATWFYDDAPPGAYSRLRLISFVASGLAAYSCYQVLEQVRLVTANTNARFVTLQWLSAPIEKEYVDFVSHEVDQAAAHRSVMFPASDLQAALNATSGGSSHALDVLRGLSLDMRKKQVAVAANEPPVVPVETL